MNVAEYDVSTNLYPLLSEGAHYSDDSDLVLTRTYAQTNIQLFNQLGNAHYSPADLGYMYDVYEFGLQIFTGRFRGSGKPFICHLVGTASILTSLHAPTHAIAAGLLHAAYIYGNFVQGDAGEHTLHERGMTDAKRDVVRRAVGAETEELIAGYTDLKWNQQTIPEIRDRLDTLSPKERQILPIRLANELEDHLDLGILYCGNTEQRREYIRSSLYLSVEMAQKLGFPALAAALECAFRDALSVQLPISITRGRNSSYILVPA